MNVGGGLLQAGTIERPCLESEALARGRAQVGALREVPVYVPRRTKGSTARFPMLVYLCGFTGQGQDQLASHPWRQKLCYRFDRALAQGRMPPAVLVFPDAFTFLGGSQYVNSSYLGDFADYVAREIPQFVEQHFPVRTGARAVLGKSSGGFGALHLAMTQPGAFQAAAALSPDCAFEVAYASELYAGLRALAEHGGDADKFLAAFEQHGKLDAAAHAGLTLLALSAAYSPREAERANTPGTAAHPGRAQCLQAEIDLPLDAHTGEWIAPVWQRWLDFDPLRAATRHAKELSTLKLLHLECGLRDEYNLHLGLRRLARTLREQGTSFQHEEHGGGHSDLDERALKACAKLLAVL